jgi:hypothetical protein
VWIPDRNAFRPATGTENCEQHKRRVELTEHRRERAGPLKLVEGLDFPHCAQAKRQHGPKKPESFLRIDEHGAIRVGITARISHFERLTPAGFPLALASTENLHVIRRAFSRTVEPADEQIALRGFNNTGRVIVPGLFRKIELPGKETLRTGRGRKDIRKKEQDEQNSHDPSIPKVKVERQARQRPRIRTPRACSVERISIC